MKIESMKEVLLSRAKDMYLFDCRVAGLDSETMFAYNNVLSSFIRFTGNVRVKELQPDHVRMYIANLSDGPSEGEEHFEEVMNYYAVIHDWVRWMYAQKFLIERTSSFEKPPRFITRRSCLPQMSLRGEITLHARPGWVSMVEVVIEGLFGQTKIHNILPH